jgi:hypothetical protein
MGDDAKDTQSECYIKVVTEVYRVTEGYSRLYWMDDMRWYRVDQDVIDWFTGSCKAALSWFVNYPEPVASDDYFQVVYSTRITDAKGNELPGTVPKAELGPLDYKGVCDFQRFALGQLSELIDFFEARKGAPTAPTKRRSKLKTLGKLVWGAIRA